MTNNSLSNKCNVDGGYARGSEQPPTRLDSTVITRKKGNEGYISLDGNNFVETVNVRVVKTGNRVEVFEYERPIKLHVSHHRKWKPKNHLKPERNQEYRRRRAHRANNNIRRLANGNFIHEAKFLTLTFNNEQSFDIFNIGECNSRYQVFIKKLQVKYPDLKYLTVLEFQQRGAVHYHILNDLPLIDKEEIAKLWGHGFIDIRKINFPEAVGGYIAKYMGKNSTDPRFSDHRSYFASKNLSRPVTSYGFQTENTLKIIEENHLQPVFSNEYHSEYQSHVKFREYNLPENLEEK